MSDRLTRTMPVVLGIDSSAAACSAAVVDGSGVLAREYLPLARGHAEVLLPMLRRVMAAAGRTFADLGAVAVTVGPGSFQGVRIRISDARRVGKEWVRQCRSRGAPSPYKN